TQVPRITRTADQLRRREEHRPKPYCDKQLGQQLLPARQSKAARLRHLRVIVDKTDGCKSEGRYHRCPGVDACESRPKESRDQNGADDQHASHRRRPALDLVRLWAFLANLLADVPPLQRVDQLAAEEE